MKRELVALMTIGFLLIVSMSVLAASTDHPKMEGMDHGKMEGMKHEGMEHSMKMDKSMIMLGDQTEDGVKAMAHLQDVKEKMAKMGMSETHHFMIIFTSVETGKLIETGTVAIKTISPSGEESAPLKLIGMQGHFGADIILKEKGKYHVLVGTKLFDGEKRQFHFDYILK